MKVSSVQLLHYNGTFSRLQLISYHPEGDTFRLYEYAVPQPSLAHGNTSTHNAYLNCLFHNRHLWNNFYSSFVISFFIYYLIFCKQELPLPSSSMGSWILFYSKCYNPSFSIFFQICPTFGQWELLQAVLCVLWRSSHKFLSIYLSLVKQDIPSSPSTSPAPYLEPVISLTRLCLFMENGI